MSFVELYVVLAIQGWEKSHYCAILEVNRQNGCRVGGSECRPILGIHHCSMDPRRCMVAASRADRMWEGARKLDLDRIPSVNNPSHIVMRLVTDETDLEGVFEEIADEKYWEEGDMCVCYSPVVV